MNIISNVYIALNPPRVCGYRFLPRGLRRQTTTRNSSFAHLSERAAEHAAVRIHGNDGGGGRDVVGVAVEQ